MSIRAVMALGAKAVMVSMVEVSALSGQRQFR
jgi:hypothetical protein